MAVSVIVPFYNALPGLERCADALRSQVAAFPCAEVIFSDAASMDGSGDFLRINHPHVRLVRGETRNLYGARNRAASAATGRILAFTDADCVVGAEWLRTLHEAVLRGADLVTGPVEPPPGVSAALRHVHDHENARMEAMCRTSAMAVAYAYTNNFAVRAELFRALGGFDEALPRGGASDFALRALASGSATMAYSRGMRVVHLEIETLRRWWFKKYLYGRSGTARRPRPAPTAFDRSRTMAIDAATLGALGVGRVCYDAGRLARRLHPP